MQGQVRWLEVWTDSSSYGTYFLLLRGLIDGTFDVADPQRGLEQLGAFLDYEEACYFLSEDEYVLIEGRYLPDE